MSAEFVFAATEAIALENDKGLTDTSIIPAGSLWAKCTAVLLRHQLRVLDANTASNKTASYVFEPANPTKTTMTPLDHVTVLGSPREDALNAHKKLPT
jgi:hypothetical protein